MAGKKEVDGRRAAYIEAALRQPELGDRERVLLGAYVHFEAMHGGRCGQPGVCWPSDVEVATYLGKSAVTVRRARRNLSAARLGGAPFVSVRYVGPFGKLPSGETSWHGANIVTMAPIAVRAPAVADLAAAEIADARAHLAALERQLESARARVAQLDQAQRIGAVMARAAANEDGGPTSHNAPLMITLGWSHVTGRSLEGEGPGARAA